MHCDEERVLIEECLDNSLSHEQSIQLETHLLGCSDCSRYMIDLRKLQNLMNSLEDEKLPTGFQQKLHSRLQQVAQETEEAKVEQETEEAEAEQEVENQQPASKKMLIKHKTLIRWAAVIAAVFAIAISLQFIQPFGESNPNNTLSGDLAERRMESVHDNELAMPQENPDANEGEDQPWISYGEGFNEEAVDTDISATVHLYVSNDWEIESKLEYIMATAETAQMLVLEKQLNKLVLQIPDNGNDQVTDIIAKLSDIGRVVSENFTKDSETMTIIIETAE